MLSICSAKDVNISLLSSYAFNSVPQKGLMQTFVLIYAMDSFSHLLYTFLQKCLDLKSIMLIDRFRSLLIYEPSVPMFFIIYKPVLFYPYIISILLIVKQ